MQRICVSVVATFIVFLLSISCDCQRGRKEESGLGFISDIKNSVYYKNFRSLVWTDARKGMPIFKGDYIRTGEKSSAIISVENERLIIGENALIKIEKKIKTDSENVSIEFIVLNGDISVESDLKSLNTISVKRLNNGRLITEELNTLKMKESDSELNNELQKDDTELLYPCNERLGINNPVLRWRGKVNGTLRIYRDKAEIFSFRINNEDSKQIELKDGGYEWDIQIEGKSPSVRCAFEVVSSNISSLSPVKSGGRKIKNDTPELPSKEVEPLTFSGKTKDEKSDIIQKRLNHVQSIIDKSIEHLRETKKSIDPAKVQNYLELYQKLDELGGLLQELKILQESLLLEVMKLKNPSEIVRYLNELEDIENNIHSIDKEIREVEKKVYKEEIKSTK